MVEHHGKFLKSTTSAREIFFVDARSPYETELLHKQHFVDFTGKTTLSGL
jgi:hypothetical protein